MQNESKNTLLHSGVAGFDAGSNYSHVGILPDRDSNNHTLRRGGKKSTNCNAHGETCELPGKLALPLVNCQHWTPRGNHGSCALGKYGGRPSLGTCTVACLGLALPSPPPLKAPLSWDDLWLQVATLHPEWLDEFKADRAALEKAACKGCASNKRRNYWTEKLSRATVVA